MKTRGIYLKLSTPRLGNISGGATVRARGCFEFPQLGRLLPKNG
jgi:hypothetical protein